MEGERMKGEIEIEIGRERKRERGIERERELGEDNITK